MQSALVLRRWAFKMRRSDWRAEVRDRDGIDLRLRVGLNSGQVIAGEIGSGALGYTAIGEQVGMAQRMESVAPPGGVMLSESTARLVDGTAALGEPELVHIKGADEPVPARRLLAVAAQPGSIGPSAHQVGWTPMGIEHRRGHAGSVGRRPRVRGGRRRARRASVKAGWSAKAAAIARGRGVNVFSAFCESHASDIPFHVVGAVAARRRRNHRSRPCGGAGTGACPDRRCRR